MHIEFRSILREAPMVDVAPRGMEPRKYLKGGGHNGKGASKMV